MAKRKQQKSPKHASLRVRPVVPHGPTALAEPSREVLMGWVTLAILGVAVLVVYARALNAPFIFDDMPSIKDNPSLVQLWPLIGNDEHPGPLNPPQNLPTAGRPLVNLTLALNYSFGELSPLSYHLFNVLTHILSAMLLASIVRRTLELEYFGGRFDRVAWLLSVVVALVWALHPLQTESVIYVTQRTELLVGFFYLATLYASLRYWSAGSDSGRRNWLILATLSCACGMASKEVMVSAPIVVLLYDRAFIAGSFRAALRRSWPLYAGLASGWLLLLWLNYDSPRGGSAGFHHGMAAHIWWFTQAKVLWIYLKLVVWPWPLIIHYEMPYLHTVGVSWPWLLPTAALAGITAVLLWRNSPVGFLLAWVWLILSPTLIVPILTEVAAERRMYLPLAALVSLAIVGGYLLLQRFGQTAKALGGLAAAALVLAAAVVSFGRLNDYRDEVTLWREAIAHQPNDPVLRNNLGSALFAFAQNNPQAGHSEQLTQAIEQFEKAIQIRPDYADAHKNLGEAYARIDKTNEAIAHFERALKIKPQFVDAHNNLGAILFALGRTDEAIAHLRQALQINPNSIDAHTNLAAALFTLGKEDEAIEQFRLVLRQRPHFPDAHNNLGYALLSSGRTREAIQHFDEAVRLRPKFAGSHVNLGMALLAADRSLEALGHFEEATNLEPENASAWASVAKIRARLGQFPQAIAAAEKALSLAQAQGQSDSVKRIEAALEAYKTGQEPPAAQVPATKAIDVNPSAK